jgi:hypothetical protein
MADQGMSITVVQPTNVSPILLSYPTKKPNLILHRSGLRQNLAVKIVAGYCVLGFVLIQILYLGVWCRPIQQYWAVPVQSCECNPISRLSRCLIDRYTSPMCLLY